MQILWTRSAAPGVAILCALLMMILGLTPALAQIPPEIPLVSRLGVGSRPLGMGGAYVAVAQDYSALYWNPAGLAQIRRIEFAGGLDSRSLDQEVAYLGNVETTPLDKSRLQSLGFAYPFPTYRGSMVIGFAYNRVALLDQDYFRTGSNADIILEEESIFEDGSVGAYEAGFAFDATTKLSLGITAVLLSGSSFRERTFYYDAANGVDFENSRTTTDSDFSAVTGTLGALVRLDPRFRLGLVLHLPESFTLDGVINEDVYRVQQDPIDTLDYVDTFSFEDKIQLPFRAAAGLSYSIPNLLLSADLTYADWKEIDYAGPIRIAGRSFAYRSTMDVRVGAEAVLPGLPVRLRAGFISQPLPYRLIATDVYRGGYEVARLDPDRRYGTVGVGLLLERSLTLDLAYVFGQYERAGTSEAGDVTVEKEEDRRLSLSAAFRL